MKLIAHVPIILIVVLLASPQRASGVESKAPAKPSAPRDELFSEPKVLQLKVEIPAAGLEALKKHPKTYVKGTVREGDKTYAQAGIRLKGNAGFQAQEKKPSLAIKFNEFTSGAHFHGHSKVILENAHQDPAYLSQAIGSEIFRAADVPAPKVTFARVELNGRDAGLYVVEQAANRNFLSGYFNKTTGNLYEGAHSDITSKLEKDSGDNSQDQTDLKKLAEAAREADPGARLKKMAAVLDLDRFISFAAAETLAWHSGYSMARNHYRIYHDPATDRMVFIPHGLDELFSKPNGPLLPEWKGLVSKAVFDNPEGQRRYRDRMAALLANACKLDVLQARVDALAGKIRPAMTADAAEAKAFEAAVASFRERIAKRLYFLQTELKK